MPSRYYRRNFIKGYYYHVYNRGVNKEKVFWDDQDYQVFTDILAYYLTFPIGKPLSVIKGIENRIAKNNKVRNLLEQPNIISTSKLCAYCLMPNHFHLILKQDTESTKENCISNLMRRTTIAYAMYAKEKYNRSGTLFQGKFKNVLVDSDAQLQQLSKYIHRNPAEILGSEPLQNYKYSSYPYFIGIEPPPDWLKINEILAFFSKTNAYQNYKKFVEESTVQIESLGKITLE